MIYLTSRKMASSSDKVYHTDSDCNRLGRSKNIYEKPKTVLTDDWRECKECADEIDKQGGQDRVKYQKISNPDFGPEDLGL